jgi:hypothetical protein
MIRLGTKQYQYVMIRWIKTHRRFRNNPIGDKTTSIRYDSLG